MMVIFTKAEVIYSIIMLSLLLFYFLYRLIKNNYLNKDKDDQLDRGKFNRQLKWYKKAFNGEEEKDRQLFFINKDDVTDVKLLYELLSAKEAVETNNVNEDYNLIEFDEQDKYCEYQIKNNNTLLVYDDTGRDIAAYKRLINKSIKIEELHEKFMKESNFDEGDLVSYYKSIIAAKKIDKDEVKSIAETYFKMVDQLYRLKTVSRSENVNEAISKAYITKGFDQSQLKQELNELLKN